MKTVFSFCVALLIGASALYAQSESASIVGTVTDASNAIVPGATVTIRNDKTNATVTLQSGSDGNFSSPPLPTGPFTVTAEHEGFKRVVQTVNLDVDQRARLDFALQPGAVSDSVTVEANAVMLETQSAELGNVRTTQAINDLPLNGRDFIVLTYLAPGTSSSGSGFTQARGASNQLGLQGVSVNGIRNGNNTYNYDGIHSQDNEYAVTVLLPPQDAIQEFKMQTSGRDATTGRTGGALVNLVTKSGGNDFHGTAFEFFRNSDLDARNFFDPPQIPAFHQNQFGASLGGRIRRDKTFFFVDLQKAFTIQGQSFLQTVPSALEKQGIFTQLSTVIYNPYSQVGNVRMPFATNTIPPTMINPIGQAIMNLYPEQDLPGLANNYSSTPARTLAPIQGDERIDHRFSDNDQIFERVSVSDVHPYNPGYFPQYAGGPIYPGPYSSTGTQAVVGYTHIFSPSFLAEFRAGYSRLNNLGQPPPVPSGFMDHLGGVGIPGIDGYGAAENSGVAEFSITGVDLVGGSGNIPFIKTTDNFQTSYHLTKNLGKHTIKWGYDLFRREMNTVQSGTPSGTFSFTGGFTQNPASPSGTGSGMADALLGLDASGGLTVWQEVGTKRWEHGLYIQDDYRVTNKLTVNLGLRWEITTPWTEEHNRLANFVPSADNVFPVGTPQVPGNSLYYTNWADFGPRFGASYALNDKTVIRAGIGYFYDFTSVSVNSLGTENPPFSGSLAITNSPTLNPATSTFTPLSQGFLPYQTIGQFNPAGLSISYWLPHRPDSSVQQRNVSLQRELPFDTILTVAYAGSRGEHLTLSPNINIPAPGPGAIAPRRPYPVFAGITNLQRSGDSYYNGLQVTGEKRFSHGLAFLAAFSWAHSIDEASTQASGTVQNILCYVCDRGSSDFDIRRSLVLSWSYELPIGSGKMIGKSWTGVQQAAFGGWKLNSIDTFQTGSPFSITSGVNTLNNGASQRANYIGGDSLVSNPGPSLWWNPAAFATPALYQYGTSGRNIVTGPGTNEIDLSLFKIIPLKWREGMRLELRTEVFNLFNKPQFDNPGENGAGSGGGTIGLPTSGTLNYAGNPAFFQRTSREIQLAMKLYF
jgi:hypothetical protein